MRVLYGVLLCIRSSGKEGQGPARVAGKTAPGISGNPVEAIVPDAVHTVRSHGDVHQYGAFLSQTILTQTRYTSANVTATSIRRQALRGKHFCGYGPSSERPGPPSAGKFTWTTPSFLRRLYRATVTSSGAFSLHLNVSERRVSPQFEWIQRLSNWAAHQLTVRR